MSRERKKDRRQKRFSGDEDVNPMNHMANLSDVMLILAVGIMLALIAHWNVDVTPKGGGKDAGRESIDKDSAVSFDDKDMEEMNDSQSLSEGQGMERLGEVYYDVASGKYYVIKQE